MKNSIFTLFILLSVLVTLQGCSSFSSLMPNNRTVPNEFKVISNPPLSLPPDFNLRPPQKDAPIKRNSPEILFGSDISNEAPIDSADEGFLSLTGASNKSDNIRSILDQEQAKQIEEDGKKNVLDKVLSYTRGDNEHKDPVVDSLAERKRIEESTKEGVHPAEGDVEESTPNKSGVLNRVFGF